MNGISAVLALLTGLACAMHAAAAGPRAEKRPLEELRLEAKTGLGAKLGPQLLTLEKARALRGAAAVDALRRKNPALRAAGDYVSVSAYGDDAAALGAQLTARGMVNASVHGHAVSGRVPVAGLRDLASIRGLRFLRPTLAMTRAGIVTTQGGRALRAEEARRRFGVDGRGIRIGSLSDSFDCASGPFAEGQPFTTAAADVASGDLPAGVRVLKDLADEPSADCFDEGRAMMQLIHDVAPGASLSFYTAFVSQEDFAAGIRALAADGADIIVDDVIYFAETMFEDGIVADAVEDVVRRGVAYFSSAGNDGRQSYESAFRSSGRRGAFGGLRHDFDPGPGVDDLQHITALPGAITILPLNWDEPSLSANGRRGSRSDVDVLVYNMDGTLLEFCTPDPEQLVCQEPGVAANIGGDAIELPVIVNLSDEPLDLQIGIELFDGPWPGLIKYVWFDLGDDVLIVNEFDTQSGTIFGHTNAAGAEAVGAAAWYQTQAWDSPFRPECVPACLDGFSSAGGVPILFDAEGRRLRHPQIRLKPGITGPDGGNTTFFFFPLGFDVPGSTEDDEFPNFFGTSASAPHVAAVAALMLDRRRRNVQSGAPTVGPPRLSPHFVYTILRLTASDMRLRNLGGDVGPVEVEGARGFDFDTGFGFVDAVRALQIVSLL